MTVTGASDESTSIGEADVSQVQDHHARWRHPRDLPKRPAQAATRLTVCWKSDHGGLRASIEMTLASRAPEENTEAVAVAGCAEKPLREFFSPLLAARENADGEGLNTEGAEPQWHESPA